jgi:hypothetical protein
LEHVVAPLVVVQPTLFLVFHQYIGGTLAIAPLCEEKLLLQAPTKGRWLSNQ